MERHPGRETHYVPADVRQEGERLMMKRLLVLAAAAVLVIPACSSDDGGIDVTVSDFKVEPAETSAPAGELTFDITNDAEQTHEFVIFKTDLAPGRASGRR